MFSQACVILFTGGSASVQAGLPPREQEPLWEQAPPEQASPWEQTPLQEQTPPKSRHPPQCRACWEIRSTHRRYASYWNAILFIIVFSLIKKSPVIPLCFERLKILTDALWIIQKKTHASTSYSFNFLSNVVISGADSHRVRSVSLCSVYVETYFLLENL